MEALALVLLVAVLAWAVARPGGRDELWAAVPAAALLIAVGALSPSQAGDRLSDVAPTLGFLAGVLVLADGCARAGVFAWTGAAVARGARGHPRRLFALTFLAASVTTAVLSLDATVVLLTPSLVAAAAASRLRATPYAYACGHLANSASLLLPVSNLTNLLAFGATGVGFAHFAALMALPWLAAIGVEWVVLRRRFAGDLAGRGAAPGTGREPAPRYALGVLAATLAGFAASSAVGVNPAWIAGAGALAISAPALRRRPLGALRDAGVAASPGFLLFVAALVLVVEAAQRHGLQHQVDALLPGGAGLAALLGVAALAAVLANLVNNLPAILILLGALHGTGPVLAALVGVGIGPNLTYAGSLATLLWRRVLRGGEAEPRLGEFVRLGAVVVPAAVVAATAALWLSLRVIG